MKWKRLSLYFITCFMFLLNSAHICFAELNGDALLEDMKQNPSEYLYIYTVGMGGHYVDKRTINVHQYEPPHYIIAFTDIYCGPCIPHNRELHAHNAGITRYSYDYNTRKAYVEANMYSPSPPWKYIDFNDNGNTQTYGFLVESADLIFYLAYGMGFYQEPTRLVNDYRKGNPHIITFTKP